MDDSLNNEIGLLEREAREDEAITQAMQADEGSESVPHVVEREPDKEMIAILSQVVSMVSGAFAPNWDIKPEEAEIVAQAGEMVLDKYVPNVKSSIGCEFALVLAVGGIILPRLKIPRHVEAIEQNKEPPEAPQAQKPVVKHHVPMDGETIDLGGAK